MENLAVAKEEENDGTTESTDAVTEQPKAPESPAQDAAPAQAAGVDESPAASPASDPEKAVEQGGDVAGIPPGAHLDAPAAGHGGQS